MADAVFHCWNRVRAKTVRRAQAIGAICHDPERSVFRAVFGATRSTPIVVRDAASLFAGRSPMTGANGFDAAAAARVLVSAGMNDRFDNQIHVAALKRAVENAQFA